MSVRMTWHGDRVKDKIDAATVRGLWLGALHLLHEAQAIVPIEEATLERSGVASVDASRFMSAVSFSTPYAVIQHESLDFRHDPGRQAKYLEAPMHIQADIILAIIAAQIRKATAG